MGAMSDLKVKVDRFTISRDGMVVSSTVRGDDV